MFTCEPTIPELFLLNGWCLYLSFWTTGQDMMGIMVPCLIQVTALGLYSNSMVSVWIYLLYNITKKVWSIHNVLMLLLCRGLQINKKNMLYHGHWTFPKKWKKIFRKIFFMFYQKCKPIWLLSSYTVIVLLLLLGWQVLIKRMHRSIKHQQIKPDTSLAKTLR